MSDRAYRRIVDHYEACLEQHGDTHRGVDWPRAEDVDLRHDIMLGVLWPGSRSGDRRIDLLDFGCGASHFYEYLLRHNVRHIRYAGLDLSEKFTDLCLKKFPQNRYYCLDVLEQGQLLPAFDYIIMNGVFTEKRELSFDTMLDYFQSVLRILFTKARIGIAFNVLSSHVDWERDDLFHLPMDRLAAFLTKDLSRHFFLRHDYGLYEYTTYVYKEATPWLK